MPSHKFDHMTRLKILDLSCLSSQIKLTLQFIHSPSKVITGKRNFDYLARSYNRCRHFERKCA